MLSFVKLSWEYVVSQYTVRKASQNVWYFKTRITRDCLSWSSSPNVCTNPWNCCEHMETAPAHIWRNSSIQGVIFGSPKQQVQHGEKFSRSVDMWQFNVLIWTSYVVVVLQSCHSSTTSRQLKLFFRVVEICNFFWEHIFQISEKQEDSASGPIALVENTTSWF